MTVWENSFFSFRAGRSFGLLRRGVGRLGVNAGSVAAQGVEVAAHVGEGRGYLNAGLPPAGQGAGEQEPGDQQEQHR